MSAVEEIEDSNSVLNAIRGNLGRRIPKGWQLTTLGACFKWSSGGTPKRTESSYFGGDIPWAVIGDLNDDVVHETNLNITPEGLKGSSAKWVEPGSVLIAMYGSIGKLGIAGRRITTNQAIAFTDPRPVDSKYLYYFLTWQRPALFRLGKGATQLNISQTVLKEFPFLLPPPAEQRSIVAEIEEQFSRLDEAVANLQRVKANLKRYRACVLADAFAGKLVPSEPVLAFGSSRTFETGAGLLARISGSHGAGIGREDKADQEVEHLPLGWAMSCVGQCFEVVVGATPSRREAKYWNGTIPWVSSGEVQFGRVHHTEESISELGFRNSSTKMNPRGSVLLGMIGQGRTRGQAAILEIDAANNQNCAAIWVSQTPIPPEFVFYWLMHRYEETRREGSGNNQQALNKKLVQAIPIPIPPLAEQHRIVAEIDRRMSIVRALERMLDVTHLHSDALRRSILALSFSEPSLAASL